MLEVSYPVQETKYILTHAVLFYRSYSETLATIHGVKNNRLLAGKSISLQDVEELFHSANQRQKMHYLPPEIIAWSRNEVIWFEKSRIRPIYFNVPEPKRKFLNEISGKNVIWPNLVFRISRQNIFCWATKSRNKPNLKTKLYNAPFTNISHRHCFCPPIQFREIREEDMVDFSRRAVDLFFRGHFSHLYDHMLPSVTYSRGRDRFWEKMVRDQERGKCKSFPNRYLVSSNMTLKEILQ